MTKSKSCELVYRATRNGFTCEELYSKCENKQNLVFFIRNNLNYVFGGYTSVAWNKYSGCITDPNAFIFSLRRNGDTKNDKFMIKNNGQFAFYKNIKYLSYGIDINSSDTNVGSDCNFGACYQLPNGITSNTDTSKSFLAGNYDQWLTTEIEVYEIKL